MNSKSLYITIFFFLTLFQSQAQNEKQKNQIRSRYNSTRLTSLQQTFFQKSKNEKQLALQMARQQGWKTRMTKPDGTVMELQRVVDGKPIYYTTYNHVAARSTRTNHLHNGGTLGLNLKGNGMTVHVWDDGGARASHREFDGAGGANRFSKGDNSGRVTDHATHVTGTIINQGADSDARGMAPHARAVGYDWNSDLAEATAAAANGMLISNHSYGDRIRHPDTGEVLLPQYFFGGYIGASRSWDQLMFNAPYYLMVASAGNNGNDNSFNTNPTGGPGFDKLSGAKTAKNNLVVANAQDANVYANGNLISVAINRSSSEGPTDDFRIKPDITGNGTNVYSSTNNHFRPWYLPWADEEEYRYQTYTGTSMASPNVAGSLLLLQEHFLNLNGSFMRSATLKGLALHTADDAGPLGPDAIFGWGLLNTKKAAEAISNNDDKAKIEELTLYNGNSYTTVVEADGSKPLIASISWTDRPGNTVATVNSTTPVLVNDLDVRISRGNTTYRPYELTGPTTSTKRDNNVDPFERINVSNASGIYTITVTHKGTLVGGNQNYTLIVTGIDNGATEIAETTFKVDDIEYEVTGLNPNTVTAIAYTGTGGDLAIPPTVPHGPNNFEVTSIGSHAFANNQLASVTMGENVATIGIEAFANNQLTHVDIGQNVTSMGRSAFEGNQLTEVTIPNHVTTLAHGVFARNQLSHVEIPGSVISIEIYAFWRNQLTEVTIPNSVTTIGVEAFSNNQLTHVDIGRNVTSMGRSAFSSNPNLATVVLKRASPPSINTNTFRNANRDQIDVVIPRGAYNNYVPAWDSFNFRSITEQVAVGDSFTKNGIKYKVTALGSTKTVVIEDYLGSYTNVYIPGTVSYGPNDFEVTSIGITAFHNNQLRSVTIPNSVISIEIYAFHSNQLTEVTIPNSVTTIKSDAFSSNPNLATVVLKRASPPSINANTFRNANRDQIDVVIPRGAYNNYVPAWDSFNFRSITEEVADGDSFIVEDITYRITALGSPNTVTITDNTNTGDLTIPGIVTHGPNDFEVTRIEESAFSGDQMTSVILPNSVTDIGTNAFENNPINKVIAESNTPPTFDTDAFTDRSTINVIVPKGTPTGSIKTAYEDAGWTGFGSIREGIQVSIDAPAETVDLSVFTVTFQFDWDVTGFTMDDIVLTNATGNNFTGNGSMYAVEITPVSGFCDGTITIDILENVAEYAPNFPNLAASTTITVNAPSVPTVDSPVEHCVSDNAVALTAIGTDLLWYTTPAGGSGTTEAPTPGTANTGRISYYVSQTINGCESQRAEIVVTVNVILSVPTVDSPVEYCVGDSPVALTATTTGTNNLLWYTSSTGDSKSSTPPTPNTENAGSTSYYVSQRNTNGCESERAEIVVTVNAPSAPSVNTPVKYCVDQTATALTATGDDLLWYTTPAGSLGTTEAPTPNTETAGEVSYYVSQRNTNGCESERAEIVVTINAPSAPSVNTPVKYCVDQTATALTATGDDLLWYTTPAGGLGTTEAPTPGTETAGEVSYYVSQRNSSGCESERAEIVVTINAPSAPSVNTPVKYCVDQTATALTATGDDLLWYTTPAGGLGTTEAPTPGTETAGEVSYYVSQRNTNGCESERVEIMVTVNAIPSAPTVSSHIEYCVDQTATALTATGDDLSWYTSATDETWDTEAPTPNTATAGSTFYFVSQTINGCESDRAEIMVTVNAIPSAPLVSSPVEYCVGDNAVALTATGDDLLWYTTEAGGTGTSTAPIPDTATVGSTFYYVSQTTNGCESERTVITVTVNALPVAPSISASSPICSGEDAVFTIAGTPGDIVTYDGASNGTVTIETDGTVEVRVNEVNSDTTLNVTEVSNGNCSIAVTEMATVTVNALPVAPSISASSPICSGEDAVFTIAGTPGDIVAYGGASNGTVTIETDGTVDVRVNGINSDATLNVTEVSNGNCSVPLTGTAIVMVNASLAPEVNSSPVEYCVDDTATALTATGDNLLWYTTEAGGTGTSTAPIPDTATVGSTFYYVSQTTNGCESERTVITVTVNALPVAPSISASSPICSGEDAVFTIAGTPGDIVTYDGASNGTVTIETDGTVEVRVNEVNSDTTLNVTEVSNGNCSIAVTEMATVTVNALPVAPSISASSPICSGEDAVFTIAGTPGDIVAYGGASNGTVTIETDGTVDVRVNGINSDATLNVTEVSNGNCSVPLTGTAIVMVNASLAPEVNSSPVEYCVDDTATALTATGDNLLWYTTEAGGTGTSTAPIPDTATVGSTFYYVSQTTNGCESERTVITVTVNALPVAPSISASSPICSGEDAVFTIAGTPGDIVTYDGASNGTVTIETDGTVEVRVNEVNSDTTLNVTEVSNGNCSIAVTEMATVTVNALRVAPSISASSPICSGEDAVFTIAGTPGDIVAYGGASNGTVTIETDGTVDVRVNGINSDATLNVTEVSNGNCSVPLTGTATVTVQDGSLTATVTVQDGSLTAIAQNITVRLDANGQATISPGDIDNGSSGDGCNNTDPVFIKLDRNTFTCNDVDNPVTVTLTAIQNGQTATATAVVTVLNSALGENGCNIIANDALRVLVMTPSCTGSADGSVEVIMDTSGYLMDILIEGDTRENRFFNNIASGANFEIDGLRVGNYTVTVRIPEISFERTFGVTVNEIGSVSGKRESLDFKQAKATYVVSGSDRYEVSVNGEKMDFTFGDTGPQRIELEQLYGRTDVVISGRNDCQGKVTDSFFMHSVLAEVYPTMTSSFITILTGSDHLDVRVHTLAGRLVKEARFTERENRMDLSFLESGVYILKITSERKGQTIKIIKR